MTTAAVNLRTVTKAWNGKGYLVDVKTKTLGKEAAKR